MSERIVLYHDGCDDGFGAAWAARKAIGGEGAFARPVQYGQPMPEIPAGAHVYLLDFAYPRAALVALHDRLTAEGGALTVLDHHKTAAEDLAGLPFATFSMVKSGARLAWEHFHPTMRRAGEIPALLEHIEDRDLWLFARPETKAISAWLRSYPRDFEVWDDLAYRLGRYPEEARHDGEQILRANAQHTEIHARAAKLVDFDGARVPCVNATMLQSEIGAELCEQYPDAPFSLTYFDRHDGARVWSLRSRPDGADCAAIAKLHGGGGHRGAAGFQTPRGWWPGR